MNSNLFLQVGDIYPKDYETVLTTSTEDCNYTVVNIKNSIVQLSKTEGFEAIVTKLNDSRTWVRIKGREYLLDANNNIVDKGRAAELPVDFDWKKKYEEVDKYIGNSLIPIRMNISREEMYKSMNNDTFDYFCNSPM